MKGKIILVVCSKPHPELFLFKYVENHIAVLRGSFSFMTMLLQRTLDIVILSGFIRKSYQYIKTINVSSLPGQNLEWLGMDEW